jgi:hypothetical protein
MNIKTINIKCGQLKQFYFIISMISIHDSSMSHITFLAKKWIFFLGCTSWYRYYTCMYYTLWPLIMSIWAVYEKTIKMLLNFPPWRILAGEWRNVTRNKSAQQWLTLEKMTIQYCIFLNTLKCLMKWGKRQYTIFHFHTKHHW